MSNIDLLLKLYLSHNYPEANIIASQILSLDPDNFTANYIYGDIAYKQGKLDIALSHLNHAYKLNSHHVDLNNDLGNLSYAMSDFDAAIVYYETAIKLKPDFILAYNNLAITYKALNNYHQAYQILKQAIQLSPTIEVLYNSLGTTCLQMGDIAEACNSFRQALAINPSYSLAYSNLLMALNYDPNISIQEIYLASQKTDAVYAASCNTRQMIVKNKIKIGYVSADFRSHPVGYFIQDVINHHNLTKFSIYCYAYQLENTDPITNIIRNKASKWTNIYGLALDDITKIITDDEIDILVDLSGHTSNNCLAIFAKKPAPVQASWIGYFATTGLKTMDYIIADKYVIPKEEEQYYSEKIKRLENNYLLFSSPNFNIEISYKNSDQIIFGCFNNLAKISANTLKLWSKILNQLPGSMLFLKAIVLDDEYVRDNLIKLLATHGIASDRVIIKGKSTREDYLKCYNEVDIMLDTHPFSGGTTTAEALWMGRPVITLKGNRFCGHITASILYNLDLPELIADCAQDYIRAAVALATNPKQLKYYMQTLRDRLLNSPLCDGKGFTAKLECCYQEMITAVRN